MTSISIFHGPSTFQAKLQGQGQFIFWLELFFFVILKKQCYNWNTLQTTMFCSFMFWLIMTGHMQKNDALETFMNGDAINAKSRFLAAGTKHNWAKINYGVQVFLYFCSFDICDFGFNAVYNSILFSSPLVLLRNLDLCGFCFPQFFLCVSHINSVN